MTTKSMVMVSVQLVCIAILVLTGSVIPRQPVMLAMLGAGIALIVWAVGVIGIYNVRVEPEVSEQAKLVTRGPYSLIRHPMYTGGVLIAAAWVWNDFSVLRLIVALVLVADFVLKLHYEERLLTGRFPEYREYMKETKRLVPFVY